MTNARETARRWRAPAVIVAALVAAGLPAAHSSASSAVSVAIEDFTFAPRVVTVPRGTTVTWVNHDEEPHTVTSATGAFRSDGLSNADSFARTFTEPGTYEYFCALHPHMKATVVVE